MQGQTQKIELALSEQAQRYVRRDAPPEVRRMAARGALPLPPLELATVLFALVHDPDDEVKTTAGQSLTSLPDGVMDAVLAGPAHPALLSWLAEAFRENEARLERIALNPAASDETVAFLATRPFRRVVDVVAHNQERLQRAPEIVEALGSNPMTGRSTIDRILSFLGFEDDGDEPEAEPSQEVDEAGAEAALRALFGDELGGFARRLLVETDEEASDEERSSLYHLVQNMSVFQKIKLGRMGNKEARSLLVRDRNKIVALAAVTSPKITDNELTSIAQSRNVPDEVIRVVANNRDVTRNYRVKLALATNPKCPQATAMKFVNYLQDKDLRALMKSKDVPTAVSTHARRILTKKGKL